MITNKNLKNEKYANAISNNKTNQKHKQANKEINQQKKNYQTHKTSKQTMQTKASKLANEPRSKTHSLFYGLVILA